MSASPNDRNSSTDDAEMRSDYLFTWKSDKWPHSELRKLVDSFESRDVAQDWWRCSAHRRVRHNDRAYMLKQGRPIGIFGIGRVVGEAERTRHASPGENPWSVQIRFDASVGDILCDPEEHLLVTEEQLSQIPVPKWQWRSQGSGVTLEASAAREIDRLSFDSIRVATTKLVNEEILRQRRLIELATRPQQQTFRDDIRKNYKDRCAVTGCATPAALEAAHIGTCTGRDDNSPTNGILFRADIHVLFDRLFITLSADGRRIEVSNELSDPSYEFLRSAVVAEPIGAVPSRENIRKHRELFLERQRRVR
jgi:hypothetical protein